MKNKTTKIKLKCFYDSKTGKSVYLEVPNDKLKELKAVAKSGRAAGKALRKLLDERELDKLDDIPSQVFPSDKIATPKQTGEYFKKRFNELR